MSRILWIIAILPVVLLGTYIYKKDRHKELSSLLVKLFMSGILSSFLVIIISIILTILFPFLETSPSKMNFFEFCFYIFISIAFIEELCKWLMTYHLGYKNKEFDEVYDILVYAVFVALGFAAFENILYVFGMQSIQIGILRGLLAIPGHVCDGITMGYYLSIARYNEKLNNQELVRQNKIKSILMPTLYHGIYDFCCLSSSVPLLIVFILFIIFLYTISIKRIKILATERTMIINRNNFCPRCGNKMTNNYCSNCGFIQK